MPTSIVSPIVDAEVVAELVVVGAGPAGCAAAIHAARAGFDVLLVDMAQLPGRDKTCGDGLTPRAMHALAQLGVDVPGPTIRGLKLHGFGGSITAPWPRGGVFPAQGSAVPRTVFDAQLFHAAVAAGARVLDQTKISDAQLNNNKVTHLFCSGRTKVIRCSQLLLAEGVRSGVARQLGVEWKRGLVHGVAARSYIDTSAGSEEWIHSHLELRSSDGVAQPGYGWMFPLGGRAANLGCGALSTSARPAKVNTKKLLVEYAESVRSLWDIVGEPTDVKSALLPMGGAVTRVAGVNWAAIGDTAALVNPLNGEGIDYALESARMVVSLLEDARRNPDGLTHMWPAALRQEYGDAFSLARRLATLLTMPGLLAAVGPVSMRGPLANTVMRSAARLMGNLVTPEDRDLTARLWLVAGGLSRGVDRLLAADSHPLFGHEG